MADLYDKNAQEIEPSQIHILRDGRLTIVTNNIGGNVQGAWYKQEDGTQFPIINPARVPLYNPYNPEYQKAIALGGASLMFPIAGPYSQLSDSTGEHPIPKHGLASVTRFTIDRISDNQITYYSRLNETIEWPWGSEIITTISAIGGALNITDNIYNHGDTPMPLVGGRHPELVFPAKEFNEIVITEIGGNELFRTSNTNQLDAESFRQGEIEANPNTLTFPENGFIQVWGESMCYVMQAAYSGDIVNGVRRPLFGVWTNRYDQQSTLRAARQMGIDANQMHAINKWSQTYCVLNVEPLDAGFYGMQNPDNAMHVLPGGVVHRSISIYPSFFG